MTDVSDFAMAFDKLRNEEESAVAVGISPLRAKLEGLRLVRSARVKRQLASIEKKKTGRESEIRAGLERLAYGRVNDAVALVFQEEITPHMLASADLYNVSEIKKIKGGGVEIKFFDRQKALERLDEMNSEIRRDRKAQSFVKSLYGGADGDVESDLPLEGEQE